MGARFGIPLVANDPRIVAAVLGLFGLFEEGKSVPNGFGDDARKIKVPLIFVFQRCGVACKRLREGRALICASKLRVVPANTPHRPTG